MRLIDADALAKNLMTITVYNSNQYAMGIVKGVDITMEMLLNAPTIDPESLRPQGEWIRYHDADLGWDEYGIRCPNCNWKVEDDDIKFSMPFCPKCGANMKKGGKP